MQYRAMILSLPLPALVLLAPAPLRFFDWETATFSFFSLPDTMRIPFPAPLLPLPVYLPPPCPPPLKLNGKSKFIAGIGLIGRLFRAPLPLLQFNPVLLT